MSRTHRDMHRIRIQRWWNQWFSGSYNWGNWGRDAMQELEHLGGWRHGAGESYKRNWRRENHVRERAILRDSLKHGGLYWYYRHKRGDGYWD